MDKIHISLNDQPVFKLLSLCRNIRHEKLGIDLDIAEQFRIDAVAISDEPYPTTDSRVMGITMNKITKSKLFAFASSFSLILSCLLFPLCYYTPQLELVSVTSICLSVMRRLRSYEQIVRIKRPLVFLQKRCLETAVTIIPLVRHKWLYEMQC